MKEGMKALLVGHLNEKCRDNFLQIATEVSVSSIGGLFGTAWMVRLIGLLQPSFRVALLSRNITSPLAMAIAGLLGASASGVGIAVAIVVVTGLFGANFGAASLTAANRTLASTSPQHLLNGPLHPPAPPPRRSPPPTRIAHTILLLTTATSTPWRTRLTAHPQRIAALCRSPG